MCSGDWTRFWDCVVSDLNSKPFWSATSFLLPFWWEKNCWLLVAWNLPSMLANTGGPRGALMSFFLYLKYSWKSQCLLTPVLRVTAGGPYNTVPSFLYSPRCSLISMQLLIFYAEINILVSHLSLYNFVFLVFCFVFVCLCLVFLFGFLRQGFSV